MLKYALSAAMVSSQRVREPQLLVDPNVDLTKEQVSLVTHRALDRVPYDTNSEPGWYRNFDDE
jgi:hypothetical protein